MQAPQHAIDLAQKLSLFGDHFKPHIVADYNGNEVMVAKLLGEFPWHSHPETDDFFLVIKGQLRLDIRDAEHGERAMQLGPGQLYVVPAGVEHRPVCDEEVHVMLIEPAGTPNTGDAATAVQKPRI